MKFGFKVTVIQQKVKEIVGKIDEFRNSVKAVFGNDVKYKVFLENLKKLSILMMLLMVKMLKKYLDYHFKGFQLLLLFLS